MKRIALIGIVTSLMAGGSALAADLPYRGQAPYYPPPPPLFTWTGLYLGINGGGSFGNFTEGGGAYFGSAGGGLIGGTIGYNYQAGPLVVGIEGDIDWADISGSNNPYYGVSSKGTVDELHTIRGRLGYAYDRTLLYVTGGYAGGSVSGRLSNYGSAPNLYIDESHYLNGYAIGAGIEYSIMPQLSVKAEYLFTSLQSDSYFGGSVNGTSSGVDVSTIRAGINYHF